MFKESLFLEAEPLPEKFPSFFNADNPLTILFFDPVHSLLIDVFNELSIVFPIGVLDLYLKLSPLGMVTVVINHPNDGSIHFINLTFLSSSWYLRSIS